MAIKESLMFLEQKKMFLDIFVLDSYVGWHKTY